MLALRRSRPKNMTSVIDPWRWHQVVPQTRLQVRLQASE